MPNFIPVEKQTVLITGAAGYICSWIVKTFLDEGFSVRATVRDLKDFAKISHLNELKKKSNGHLKLVEADLMHEGSFDEPAKGCEILVHTASPFIVQNIKDNQKQLVIPAVEGTKNVLSAANKSDSLRRVVLTSSVAAIHGDNCESGSGQNGTFNESDWNTSSSGDYNPYQYSKTMAEKMAWKMAENANWDLVVLNPGFILGPSLSTRIDGASVDMMRSLLNGKYRLGVPDICLAFVDIRDVARAHFLVAEDRNTAGRFILVSEVGNTPMVAEILRSEYGKTHPIPKNVIPKWLVKMTGFIFGLKRDYLERNVGHSFKIDNRKSLEELGLTYRPVRDTILDHAEQLISLGLV